MTIARLTRRQVRHRRYVREGDPGHEPGGRREVGGGRAEEDLRGV